MSKPFLYLFSDMDSLDNDFIEKTRYSLPQFRQEQCNRYRQDTDKKACIMAYLLLVKGLREQYNISQPVSFIYTERGKPYLREFPEIFFNLSHCKNAVACALADYEIGVDIQDICPFDMNVVRRVCNNEELYQLEKSDNPAKLFSLIWTEKESYAKAKGESVASVLKQELVHGNFYSCQEKNYCVTLCYRGLSPSLVQQPTIILLQKNIISKTV